MRLSVVLASALATPALADDLTQTAAAAAEIQREQMTLWWMIHNGGVITLIIALLSVAALALVLYLCFALRATRVLPRGFVRRCRQLVEAGDVKGCVKLCSQQGGMLARVLLAGLERAGQDRSLILEAMQNAGTREVTGMWQQINWLSDVATLSPLLGILGTVVGMMYAFNAVVSQTAVVKPMMLAAGVSQAMITTAAGLVVAIPASGFFFYFRGKAQAITSSLEEICADFAAALTAAGGKAGGRR